MSVDRERNRDREVARAPTERPRHELPILKALLPEHAETIGRAKTREDVTSLKGYLNRRRAILTQERADPSE